MTSPPEGPTAAAARRRSLRREMGRSKGGPASSSPASAATEGRGRRALHALHGLLRGVLLFLAAAVIWIEEWGWQPLAAAAAQLVRWLHLERIEALLRRAPPRVALLLFLLPAVALFPLKLGALWLIHEGHRTLGVGVIVLAKLLGTALVGRLFILVEPQLMQFPWLARIIGWWHETRLRVRAAVRRSAPWRRARMLRRRMRLVFRHWRERLRRWHGPVG